MPPKQPNSVSWLSRHRTSARGGVKELCEDDKAVNCTGSLGQKLSSSLLTYGSLLGDNSFYFFLSIVFHHGMGLFYLSYEEQVRVNEVQIIRPCEARCS